ncbi:hypothetical protein HYFRA_00011847 [Hymenoscyphus fraxineus]|uniref:Peptidase S54 rhomboid domain-containing protein n=1 Tax=Hymenoscyphus fraxineus TaxID=746836 RepID=A0A9N9KYZ4_9HELO|nr:hypothetical protein HYFRA_00011847 [Hymenoscyphus fraxineus]
MTSKPQTSFRAQYSPSSKSKKRLERLVVWGFIAINLIVLLAWDFLLLRLGLILLPESPVIPKPNGLIELVSWSRKYRKTQGRYPELVGWPVQRLSVKNLLARLDEIPLGITDHNQLSTIVSLLRFMAHHFICTTSSSWPSLLFSHVSQYNPLHFLGNMLLWHFCATELLSPSRDGKPGLHPYQLLQLALGSIATSMVIAFLIFEVVHRYTGCELPTCEGALGASVVNAGLLAVACLSSPKAPVFFGLPLWSFGLVVTIFYAWIGFTVLDPGGMAHLGGERTRMKLYRNIEKEGQVPFENIVCTKAKMY